MSFRSLCALALLCLQTAVLPRMAGASEPASPSGRSTSQPSRPFTIRDSIEFSRFTDAAISLSTTPNPRPLYSPNGRSFLLVTQRGRLDDDAIEATIWLFDTAQVERFVQNQTDTRPMPTAIVRMAASSSLPILSGVRWDKNSRSIYFLGRTQTGYQRLFRTNLASKVTQPMTGEKEYVLAYDIAAETLAYTTLVITSEVPASSRSPVVIVGNQSFESLLYPKPETLKVEDIKRLQWDLPKYASELHVKGRGKNKPLQFRAADVSLRLFAPAWSVAPPLAISPDGESLITVAPVHDIPRSWSAYGPGLEFEFARIKPDSAATSADDNDLKPLQFVLVDLESGEVTPLVDAPIGRNLVYILPAEAYWLRDGHSAVLTNTFLPLRADAGSENVNDRFTHEPFVTLVDTQSRKLQPLEMFSIGQLGLRKGYRLDDIDFEWRSETQTLTVSYGKPAPQTPPPISFQINGDGWKQVETPNATNWSVRIFIEERYDLAPHLAASKAGNPNSISIWNPNPQLDQLALGGVSLYKWNDQQGYAWSGLLALPPQVDRNRRYPLVIQTHGYDLNSFFLDGMFTTGSGGRALNADDIVVLQMEEPATYLWTPEDGAFALAGFESAIQQLAKDGLVDPDQIGVIGFSYTCFHTLFALANHPKLFAAATITDGNNMSYSQYILDENVGDYQDISERMYGGKPWGGALAAWTEKSPDFNLDKVQTPLLIAAFERGQLLRQWEPYAGLHRLGKPVELMWLQAEDAPHVLIKPSHRLLSQQSAVDWFNFWLNGHEDPAPSKAQQYKRWRLMKPKAQVERP